MELTKKVTALKGVGPKKAQALEKLEIRTIDDLLRFFPRDYEDRRSHCAIADLQEDRPAFVRGKVELVVKDPYRKGRQVLRVLISDSSGRLEVVFFNARYLAGAFKVGNTYDFFGKPSVNYGKMQMVHPDFAAAEKGMMQGILPVYPLTAGLSQKEMRAWQKTAMEAAGQIEEYLPEDMISRNRLCSLEYAIKNVHFPEERQPLLAGKYRLVFDELLALQCGLLVSRQRAVYGKKGLIFPKEADVRPYIESFTYQLTGAQKRVVREINEDLESGRVMNRLVQGDVGSGKTAVAEIALYKAVKSGFQGAMMAPTELLARQHFAGLSQSFAAFGIKVGLLTGSMPAKEKREVLEQLALGQIQILVGTHALIQPDVRFAKLGLVITDEQHRFGVRQRTALSEKGCDPHVLVMTATPIPRTLAVILYGDLDVSVIDELPPGRQKILTRAIEEKQRQSCYDFVEKELEKGRQAYVVAPLIDESEVLDAKSAEELYEELSRRFKGHSVALLHGAMKQQQKDQIMTDFYEDRIQVLVSTVVIEVGINVPNATIIVIENAERFGLAQLHQLRGRVGRGSHQSYCMLVCKQTSEVAKKRAQTMVESQDGFYIAEQDLALRGPGEIFGTRQHGVPDLAIADLAKHIKILNDVKKEAEQIIEEDPFLESEKYTGLKKRVIKLFGADFSLKL